MTTPSCSLSEFVETACLLEARARKPGNVHPAASFADMCYDDFVLSSRCIAPVFARAGVLSLGQLVLGAVQATRNELGKNTNLGIILILAPLAAAKEPTPTAVSTVLNAFSHDDTHLVYEAIRLARPGGLNEAEHQDVRQAPTVTLLEAMRLAADHDLIARQYVTNYADIFTLLLPTLEEALVANASLEQAIIFTHLKSLACLGDTLILRKCGPAVADEAQRRAREVVELGWPRESAAAAYHDLDAWLRADGHRRNPGTTADLIAGALFLALRKGSIELPLSRVWECPVL